MVERIVHHVPLHVSRSVNGTACFWRSISWSRSCSSLSHRLAHFCWSMGHIDFSHIDGVDELPTRNNIVRALRLQRLILVSPEKSWHGHFRFPPLNTRLPNPPKTKHPSWRCHGCLILRLSYLPCMQARCLWCGDYHVATRPSAWVFSNFGTEISWNSQIRRLESYQGNSRNNPKRTQKKSHVHVGWLYVLKCLITQSRQPPMSRPVLVPFVAPAGA